jgi:transposase-like protein
MPKHTPIDVIVAKVAGGCDAEAARLIGVARSTLSCWRSAKRRGPLAGAVPMKYHARILELAQEQNVTITPDELLNGG